MMIEDAWIKWQDRFEYWKKFSANLWHGIITKDRDWWLSRWTDDHPREYMFDIDLLWERHIGPALLINPGNRQLRLF